MREGDGQCSDIPEEVRGNPPVFSYAEKPGGASLEGIENPGGTKLGGLHAVKTDSLHDIQ